MTETRIKLVGRGLAPAAVGEQHPHSIYLIMGIFSNGILQKSAVFLLTNRAVWCIMEVLHKMNIENRG